MTISKVPLTDQIAEVKRELALRRNVYPQFVARGKMDQSEADDHLQRMAGVLQTLEWMAANRERLGI